MNKTRSISITVLVLLFVRLVLAGERPGTTRPARIFHNPQQIILALPNAFYPRPGGRWTEALADRANNWLIHNAMDQSVQWTLRLHNATTYDGPTKKLIVAELVWSDSVEKSSRQHCFHLLSQDWDFGEIQASFDRDTWKARIAKVQRQTPDLPGDLLTVRGTLREFLIENVRNPNGKTIKFPLAHLDIRLSDCQIIGP